MEYYISNKINNGYNAGSKARNDCETIFKSLGLNKLEVKEKKFSNNFFYNKIEKIYYILKNIPNYIKNYKLLRKNDIIFYQFPSNNIYEKILLKIIRLKKGKLIPIIHDLEGIRFNNLKKKREEIKYLNKSYQIISHNKEMTKFLQNEYKIYIKTREIFIFDYLVNEAKLQIPTNNAICYAGNLIYKKSSFIYNLNKIKNINFNVYGKNYQKEKNNNAFKYCGAFSPEVIHKKLEGKFGLIWDGNSLEKCDDLYGEYLKYNSPHKFSLYIASKLPVITWDKAAISSYILENKLGIVVSSLKDLEDKLENISEEEYKIMKENVIKLSGKITKGEILKNTLFEIIQEGKNEE